MTLNEVLAELENWRRGNEGVLGNEKETIKSIVFMGKKMIINTESSIFQFHAGNDTIELIAIVNA